MKENATCIAKNRSASVLVYTVDNIRREFQPGESKKVPFAELEKLSYKRGGARILQDYLMIKEDEAIQELGIHVEPEYKMSKEDVIELINNGSQDAWLDCLDFAPEGVLDMVKQLSVSIPLNDYAKRRALKEKTGFDVDAAIRFTEEDQINDKSKEAPKRRIVKDTSDEQPIRRITYKK